MLPRVARPPKLHLDPPTRIRQIGLVDKSGQRVEGLDDVLVEDPGVHPLQRDVPGRRPGADRALRQGRHAEGHCAVPLPQGPETRDAGQDLQRPPMPSEVELHQVQSVQSELWDRDSNEVERGFLIKVI